MRLTATSASRALLATAVVSLGAAAPRVHAAAPPSARILYEQARLAEKNLTAVKKLRDNPRAWAEVARRYRQVVIFHPTSGYADDALYYEAEIHREIDRRFGDRKAAARAVALYLRVAEGYPTSKWCAPARFRRADLFLNRLSDAQQARKELQAIVQSWPRSGEAGEARKLLADLDRPRETNLVRVRNIRHWTGSEYTRIVIDLDEEVPFTQNRLVEPDRIYFDLYGAELSRSLATRSFPVDDAFLKTIRVAQNKPDVVRLVLDFDSISRYNVFSLQNPYRLVVDILGIRPEAGELALRDRAAAEPAAPASEAGLASPTAADGSPPPPDAPAPPALGPASSTPAGMTPVAASTPATSAAPPTAETVSEPPPLPAEPTADGRFSLARQLGLRARRVVIDPGHGGHDPGALGRGGLREKDVVLDVARRVASMLEAEGFDVLMTRDDDTFIPLEERTAIANAKGADLFVSIHANSSRNRRARGIETYYLNLATTPEAEETAARENAINARSVGELSGLLRQIMNNSRIAESRDFAGRIQRAMSVSVLKEARERDLGVKTAPFYVLLGANMPSVLIETSFLSNLDDARLLARDDYREALAESILAGIVEYAGSLKPATQSVANGRARGASGQH
jgi:N-acetylmuramoyl-L-alanine amidase